MQEDFLHFIWQYQKFSTANLTTVCGKSIQVITVGTHNVNSGPDFFNSKISIDNQLWVGTVELHIKASDWYVHKHQHDSAYSNVILHVVWEANDKVYDNYENEIVTLELKSIVDVSLVQKYKKLIAQKSWINCENEIHTVGSFTISNWKEKLLINRLQRKAEFLEELLCKSQNNWEEVLFIMLAESFGLKINATQFKLMAKSISFSVLKKERVNRTNLEALFFGQSNLLAGNDVDSYYDELKKTYTYLKQKHGLKNSLVKLDFFRLRPANFPTIRLSQLASLYSENQNLFSKIIVTNQIKDLYKILTVAASDYWDIHYTFGNSSIKRKKVLSKSFINVLIINTVIPLKYAYEKSLGSNEFEKTMSLYAALKSENNSIVNNFKELEVSAESAVDSQALIELKTQYCDKHKCLHCEIGNKLLNTL